MNLKEYQEICQQIKGLEVLKDAIRKEILKAGPGVYDGFRVNIVDQQRTTVAGHERIKEVMGEECYGVMQERGLINRTIAQLIKIEAV